jgi:hypothetical protein
MRISFRVSGHVFDTNAQAVENPAVLSTLGGWCYEEACIYNYVDMELVDQGVIGGTIRAAWNPGRGLEIVTDYWAPDTLDQAYINQLRDETLGQLSDGIGHGGFELTLEGKVCFLVAETRLTPDAEIVYDGKPVPIPSRIARAGRDGDIGLLQEAIASGEAIDATIQGYSGLHLAILYGHVDAALLLISKGANPNLLTGGDGETPLHLCALSNSLSDSESAIVAQALINHGADKTIRTPDGRNTAASFADNRQKTALLEVLNQPRLPE